MKYGLVLSGGGSKGAYESGCMKALQELGYHFDIIKSFMNYGILYH